MARLRAPDGCPWDREQTLDTIKPYTLEETYEVMDAIDRRDYAALSDELGDLILQAVFYAQIAREEGRFSIADSLDRINEKLIRRHPHVFADGKADTASEVKERWDEIKAEEKQAAGKKTGGVLDGVLRMQPALAEATQMSQRAAGVGFEWVDLEAVLDKVREELDELAEARERSSHTSIEGEIGDLFFTLVNVARFLKVDPEQALRRTNAKFRRRFSHVEEELRKRGLTPAESARKSGVEEMEALWQEAKKLDE